MERLAFQVLALLQRKLFYYDNGIAHGHLPALNLLLILFKSFFSKAFFL